MSNQLIIDARRRLSWNRRLFSDASTLALWSVWLWLCRSALLRVIGTFGMALGFRRVAYPVSSDSMLSFEDAAAALLGTCSVLMLWNRLATQTPVTPRIHISPDYAGYFGLDPRELAVARAGNICTVHHDEAGRILRIDTVNDDAGDCELQVAA